VSATHRAPHSSREVDGARLGDDDEQMFAVYADRSADGKHLFDGC